jgi:DNA-binding SARP family transcriptional activator
MEFRLLGPLEVIEQHRLLALGGGRQRSLFGVLLLHANQVVSTDRLMDALWGQAPPLTAAKSIQVYVSKLRKELGEGRLVTRAPGYVLKVDHSELDLARFERLLGEARNADPHDAAQKLRRALSLWRGPALADLTYEPFVLPVSGRRFVEAFEKVIRGRVAPYTITTAQATEVLLDAIAASDGTRASVTKNLLRTRVEDGILGSFEFDANGDTTAAGVTMYRIEQGTPRVLSVITPPESLR